MSGARVLVTGAGGFIGRWSLPRLRASGFEVHAVSSRARALAGMPEFREVTVHEADLLSMHAATGLIRALRPSHLLHLAWIATPGVYADSPLNDRWLDASRALLHEFLACGGSRVVGAGTCAEYAPSGRGPCIEGLTPLADAAAGGVSPYARCKLALGGELGRAARVAGASSAWGRVFLQFGPHEPPERLVPSVIRRLLRGEDAPCSHGRQVRGFLHVADVGDAFAALLASPVEGTVNIGSDRSLTIGGLVEAIAARIGGPGRVLRDARPAPANEPAVLVADATRLRREVGWTPSFDLDAALEDTIDWWRAERRR
ncbi:MAG: NAD(P)-dependent oxidoreductase [Gammaproteobacteria bacterium]|nr:NAD(P)-dependent oxidoreductase [Gammaproteobacteria bacterium]